MLLKGQVKQAVHGLPMPPVAWPLVEHAWLDMGLRWFVVVFEAGFFLVVFRRLRSLFITLALEDAVDEHLLLEQCR